MVWFIGLVYVVGWFFLCVSGVFELVAMLRGKATNIQIAGPFLLIVGLPVYFAGSYLRENVDSPSVLMFWVPAILGAVVGAVSGYAAGDPS